MTTTTLSFSYYLQRTTLHPPHLQVVGDKPNDNPRKQITNDEKVPRFQEIIEKITHQE